MKAEPGIAVAASDGHGGAQLVMRGGPQPSPWPQVVLVFIFVAGAIAAAALTKSEALAAVLAGAAAGIVVPGLARRSSGPLMWLPVALALGGGVLAWAATAHALVVAAGH